MGFEGLIIYDYDNMPKDDGYIKFQTTELNELFKYEGRQTKWHSEKTTHIAFFEYCVAQHRVLLTVKVINGDAEIVDILKKVKDEAGLEVDGLDTRYWHIKSYSVDYDKVLNATDKGQELYDQLTAFVPQIKEFLISLSKKFNS